MRGAPHSGFSTLIRRISARRSASIFGRPPRERDFQRQYRRKPARCQRTRVSGRMIVMALRIDGNHRYSMTCRDPGPRPELRIWNAAAQTRMVSVARIRFDFWKSVRHLKWILPDDISEFESDMPSQAVRSLWVMSGLQKYVRHSR